MWLDLWRILRTREIWLRDIYVMISRAPQISVGCRYRRRRPIVRCVTIYFQWYFLPRTTSRSIFKKKLLPAFLAHAVCLDLWMTVLRTLALKTWLRGSWHRRSIFLRGTITNMFRLSEKKLFPSILSVEHLNFQDIRRRKCDSVHLTSCDSLCIRARS